MFGHLRIKSPWKQLLVLLLVASPLLLTIGLAVGTDVKVDMNKRGVVESLKWSQAFSSLAFFFLPAFLYAVFTFTGKYFYQLGFRKADKQNMYVLGIICILMAFPIVFWLGQLNQLIPMPESLTTMEKQASEQIQIFLKANSTMDVIVNVLIIALLPAICEEMFFRGALQRVLIHITRNPWVGIILTGFLFSALHLQFQGFLPRMFLGIVLGVLFWYSGSLWTCILAHFVNNAVQVIAVSYAPKYIAKNPDTPILAAIISAVAVWAILWYYQRQSSITYAKVYRIDDLTPTNQFIA